MRFGATVDIERAYYQPPNKGIGAKQAPRPAYKDAPALKSGTWKLDDGTTAQATQKVAHNIRMGQDALDPNGGLLLAGLGFSYINDAPNEVILSELSFETSTTELPLDAFGVTGTALFNPQVTLNGIIQATQPSYTVPIGGTLEFLFPSTDDLYFIVRGLAFAGSLDQVGFAYETLLVQPVPEPSPWILVASIMILLMWIRYLPQHGSSLRKFSYKARGGRNAALFDGTEKVVSWDSFPWYIRTVSAP